MATILIVDDSKAIRLELGDALAESGHVVVEGVDGDDGLRQAKGHPEVDLIIADYNMPGMNGIRMCEEIKKLETFKNTPIMILTSHSDSNLKEQGRDVGVKVWVIKPIIPVKLLFVVDRLLKAR